ncbi:hypothetical protein CKAN_00859100 [Cinnamomum micranthum f. kanehirae]|uniref:Uncharacterized protein n=1 Tax=Cinnamomum micranthum f. kanehirae TaxID=337451 RepID=A0A443NNE2_9MAGN|nr:hypothetical protein CKAN_00859100 [Cinnamomum micranthum f. kanehirae]
MKSQQKLLLGFKEPSSFSEDLPTLPPLLDHHSRPIVIVRSNIMPSIEAISSLIISLSNSVAIVRSVADNLIHSRLQDYLLSTLYTLLKRNFSSRVTIFINYFDGIFIN